MPAFSGTRGALAAALLFSAAACSNPTLNTDLNTKGPPKVVEVHVLSQGAGAPAATWCTSDTSLKVNASYCPNMGEVTDAPPTSWYLRVVFDKLLNPDIETLVHSDAGTTGNLSQSKPFTITCGGKDVGYTGFYDPSGNYVTDPPGPALVAQIDYPNSFGATGSECEIKLKSSAVIAKNGQALGSSDVGPYKFKVAAMAVDAANTVPADQDTGVDPTAPIVVPFNAPVDTTTLKDSSGNPLITVADGSGKAVAATLAADMGDPTAIVITPTGGLKANTMYTVTVKKTGIKDIAGGPLNMMADFSFSFTTGMAMAPDGGAPPSTDATVPVD